MYPPNQPQLPHRPPFVVSASVTQPFQQYLPLATGMAMLMAMQSANVSPFRTAYVGQASQNNWQNPLFEQLARATAQLGEVLVATQRMPVEQALQTSADQCLQMLTALFVHQNHHMFPQLADPATAQAIQALLQKYQGVEQDVARFYQHMSVPSPAMGYGAPGYSNAVPTRGYQDPFRAPVVGTGIGAGSLGLGNSQPAPQPAVSQSFTNPYQEPDSYARYGQPKSSDPAPTTGYRSALRAPSQETKVAGYRRASPEETQTTGVVEELRMDTQPTVQIEPLRPRSSRSTSTPVPPPVETNRRPDLVTVETPAAPAVPEVQEDQERQWYTLPELGPWPKVASPDRPWDAVLLENGDELRPAHLSTWTVTRSDQPYTLAYDPGTQIKFHIRHHDSDTVTETILQWEDSMDYLEHELDREARARYRMSKERNENVAVDMGKINRLRQVDNSPIAAVDPAEEANRELVGKDVQFSVVEAGIRAFSLQEAQKRVQIKLAANKIDTDEPYEYYVDLIHSSLCKQATIDALDAAVNATEPTETVTQLLSIQDKDTFQLANRMMTDRINQVMNNMLGVQWRISSFVEDCQELMDELRTTYGDFVTDQLINRYDGIVGAGLPLQTEGPGVDFAISRLGLDPQELEQADFRLAVFQERVSVTTLPWTLEDLQVQLSTREPSLIDAERLPHLHACMESILKRSLDFPIPYRHHYILLKDGKMLELYRGYLIDDSILLRISDDPDGPRQAAKPQV